MGPCCSKYSSLSVIREKPWDDIRILKLQQRVHMKPCRIFFMAQWFLLQLHQLCLCFMDVGVNFHKGTCVHWPEYTQSCSNSRWLMWYSCAHMHVWVTCGSRIVCNIRIQGQETWLQQMEIRNQKMSERWIKSLPPVYGWNKNRVMLFL